MAEKITPQGYIYGMPPKSTHPFWGGGGGGDIDEYVKSLDGTVTDTENGKIYTINATDGDDVVSKVIDILVPNSQEIGTYAENVTVTSQHANEQTTYTIKYTTSDDVEHTAGTVIVPDTPIIPPTPTDYVTSIIITHTDTATSDTYAFKYITKDGIEHGMGSVYVNKDYVNNVSVSQSTSQGVKTVTITVDNTTYNFDVPVAYLKSIVQSAGQVDDDVFTFTDENGHAVDISSPGEYIQFLNLAAASGSASLTNRKIVNGAASTSTVGTIRLSNNQGTHTIEIEDNAGNSISDTWNESSGGGGVGDFGTDGTGHYNLVYVRGTCTANIKPDRGMYTPFGNITPSGNNNISFTINEVVKLADGLTSANQRYTKYHPYPTSINDGFASISVPISYTPAGDWASDTCFAYCYAEVEIETKVDYLTDDVASFAGAASHNIVMKFYYRILNTTKQLEYNFVHRIVGICSQFTISNYEVL